MKFLCLRNQFLEALRRNKIKIFRLGKIYLHYANRINSFKLWFHWRNFSFKALVYEMYQINCNWIRNNMGFILFISSTIFLFSVELLSYKRGHFHGLLSCKRFIFYSTLEENLARQRKKHSIFQNSNKSSSFVCQNSTITQQDRT